MTFYLGTHKPHWLYSTELPGVPLFISARRLRDQRTWRPSRATWALDSGGFTELSMYGKWTVSAAHYVDEIRKWFAMIGPAVWCAPQDWMCEPHMVEKTGLSVQEHQYLTTTNYLTLRELAPEVPFIPVLQGWTADDYWRHVRQYEDHGVRLTELATVGVGSVCRRQAMGDTTSLLKELHTYGVRLHGFGFKLTGLRQAARYLTSADSMAWSLDARRAGPQPGCKHRQCSNCIVYAAKWYAKAVKAAAGGE